MIPPSAWNYVLPAYGLTWATIAVYTFSLWLRRPKGKE